MRQRCNQFSLCWLIITSLSLLIFCFGQTLGEEHCEFRCKNDHCISSLFVCDQDDDCGDLTDEEDCPPIDEKAECPAKQFQCSDRLCIPEEWVCDGKQDCLDGSDEVDGCHNAACVDGFTCVSTHLCIPHSWRCDGANDCMDNSDEQNCSKRHMHISNCTLENQLFKCKDESTCIELIKTCNGHPECMDSSDEGSMCLQADLCKTVNCSTGCHMTPQGPVCTCPKGFSYTENKCEDINECTIYGICDQKCHNQRGSYSCFCEPGYHLETDNHTCRAEEAEGLLLFSSVHQIRAYFIEAGMYIPIASNLSHVTAVAYDGNHVYWTNILNGEEAIMRSADDGTNQEILVTAGLGSPEDMALDWLTRNIYFTDSKMHHIGVCSNDGVSCVVLHNRDIDMPRGIVLQPTEGLMYWSDWGVRPLIARSGMDGSEPTDFISDNIHWPNSLAIDHGNQRLYWVDAKLHKIESIKLDGTDRRVVLTESIKHPYSIAVFEDSIYWSDWEGREIQACNKFTGKNRRRIIREKKNTILGVHIYHPSMMDPRMSNPCADSACSDLCLVAPVSKPLRYTCACPEEKILGPNGHACIQTRKKNAVVIGAGHTLFEIEHKRLGRQIISEMQLTQVDKIGALAYDSLKGNLIISDAANRKIVMLDMDNEHEMSIVSDSIGKVSGMDFDPYGNNLYWTDSEHRTVEVISLETHERTTVISDLGGDIPTDVALVSSDGIMFIALSGPGGAHIDKWSMDGDPKSRMHIIEGDILGRQISLTYDRDLHQLFWADPLSGYIEKIDLNGVERHLFRELYSTPSDIAALDSDVFWTNRGTSMINWADKYDGDAGNKEINLELTGGIDTVRIVAIHSLDSGNNHLCQHETGGCSHLCLLTPNTKVCGCPVGMKLKMDNHNCEYPNHCHLNEFHCPTGECIPESLRCNHRYDCPEGEDELNCDRYLKQCPRGQFSCHNGELCLDENLKCNGYINCRDGSDELNCQRQEDSNCKNNEFTCKSGECISSFLRCNNRFDCSDGSDEDACQTVTCDPVHHFRCSSGQCIPAKWECDNEVDCADKSDEHCLDFTCGSDQIMCENRICVDKMLMCDHNDDCGDNTDEMNCSESDDEPAKVMPVHPGSGTNKHQAQTCIDDKQFACESQPGVCLPIHAKCNGTSECLRGEDENECGCTKDQFKCANSDRCILRDWVCDNNNDCGDNSDEDPYMCQFIKNNSSKEIQDIGSPCNHEFQCRNKKCLSFTKVCDGHIDCGDGSDEGGLCGKSCAGAGCSDHCQETPVGFQCSCFSGYKLLGDGKKCTDIDECKLGIYCAQDCKNTPGSYSCECRHAGYQLKEDRMSCKAVGSEMKIIYVLEDKIRYISKSQVSLGVVYSSRLADLRVLGLDVDARRQLVYWSSGVTGMLSRLSLENRNNIETISNIQRPGKISLDWVTENIYFVENSRQIKVCHFVVQKCALIYTADTGVTIHTLAVDPISRTLFWSESSSFGDMFLMSKCVIKRSDLSGSSILVIVDTTLEYVVDIVIDNIHNKIFWVDQLLKTVETATFDGTDRDILFHSPEEPIEVELFEDSIYWLVRSRVPHTHRNLQVYGNVWQCGLFGPTVWNCDMIKIHPRNMLGSPQRFKIMQEALQQEDNNDCKNINCSHLCVLTPSEPVCLCEDGSQITPDRQCKNTTVDGLLPRPQFTMFSSPPPSSKEDSNLWWLLFFFLFVFILLPGVIIVLYVTFQEDIHKYFQSKPNKFKFSSIHFQNPSYGMSHRQSSFHHSRLSPGLHQYENPITDKVDEENVYIVHANEMKITNGDECNNKKNKIQVIDVADDESSGTEYTDTVSESHKAPLIR